MLWHRQDLRDGVRTLRRQPAFTLAVVVTFALAIGTTTAIFAALDAVILTPLPFRDPEALVVAWGQDPARAQPVREVSHAQFREWQARARGFSGLAVMSSANSPMARRESRTIAPHRRQPRSPDARLPGAGPAR